MVTTKKTDRTANHHYFRIGLYFSSLLVVFSQMINHHPTLIVYDESYYSLFSQYYITKEIPRGPQENRSELKDLGASEEEVLTELRRQRQERLKAPEESLLRAQRIQKLHGGSCGKSGSTYYPLVN